MPELKVGDPAPDFSLPCESGEVVSLAGLRGKQVVLYFYPKDDTSGCTVEACGFRDQIAAIERAEAVVLGISPDDRGSHQRFIEKFSLPFRLLVDEDGTVQKAYGVYRPLINGLIGPRRRTFVIDQAGRLKAIFPKVRVHGHAQEVLTALRS
ncbi:MAG: peroxiredoxin [Nitrospirota bacterium]